MKAADLRIPAPTLVREEALKKLREAIIDGYFVPGERLVESNIYELLGVSRPLLREVFRHLESEGLIVAELRKGYRVAKITSTEAEEIYEVRALLEPAAMRAASERATGKDVIKLRRIFDNAARAAVKADLPRLVSYVSEFHSCIFEMAGNRVSAEILMRLHARISLMRAPLMSEAGRVQVGIKEVRAIVDAIERRNSDEVFERRRITSGRRRHGRWRI